MQLGARRDLQSTSPKGGTALHEAVARKHYHLVDLFLQYNADPFVENIRSYTALDLACELQNVSLLRRLEAGSVWRGWLLQKVPRLGGLGTEWQRRWVVVCVRKSSPFTPPERYKIRVVLLCYKNLSSTIPCCRAWLDGSKSDEMYHPRASEQAGGCTPHQATVTLHRRYPPPSASFTTGNNRIGYSLYFRPDEASEAGCRILSGFMAVVNNNQQIGQQTQHQPGQGGPSSPSSRASHGSNVANNQIAPSTHVALDEQIARTLQSQEDEVLAAHLSAGNLDRASHGAQNNSASPRPPVMNASTPPASQPSATDLFPQIYFASSIGNDQSQYGNVAAAASALAKQDSKVAGSSNEKVSKIAEEEGKLCCICLEFPADTSFIHGNTGHLCACYNCAQKHMELDDKCPQCRTKVDAVIKTYIT